MQQTADYKVRIVDDLLIRIVAEADATGGTSLRSGKSCAPATIHQPLPYMPTLTPPPLYKTISDL